jgi:hypothetical protein
MRGYIFLAIFIACWGLLGRMIAILLLMSQERLFVSLDVAAKLLEQIFYFDVSILRLFWLLSYTGFIGSVLNSPGCR